MLYEIAEGLYAYETVLSLPMGLVMPTRATVARLDDGSLALCSPLLLDDATKDAIDALGEVRAIVAPSLLHYLYVQDAHARFPEARVFASASLRAKVPALPGEDLLPSEARSAPLPGLEASFLAGAPAFDETVFFHARSGTLLCADLVFNITAPSTLGSRFVLTCVGCNGRLGQSRVWRFAMKDAPTLRARTRGLFDWPFERVVMGHGDVLDVDARACMEAALARTLL